MSGMNASPRWNAVVGPLALGATVAFNVWLFRLGFFYGLIGLNLTKHVAVAVLCRAIGVPRARPGPTFRPAHRSLPRPHALTRETS